VAAADRSEAEPLERRVENGAILECLREAAEPATSAYRLGAWELHAHPDLCERFDEVAPGGRRVEVYGLPGRAGSGGVLYAVARGTSGILLRLPSGPARDAVLASGGAVASDIGSDWVRADAWLTDVPSAAGLALLAEWVEAARSAADA
jgi:hypothetical protein